MRRWPLRSPRPPRGVAEEVEATPVNATAGQEATPVNAKAEQEATLVNAKAGQEATKLHRKTEWTAVRTTVWTPVAAMLRTRRQPSGRSAA